LFLGVNDDPPHQSGRLDLCLVSAVLYFDAAGASNGSTEAINGLIELHRRIARSFRNRDNYRLRMLFILPEASSHREYEEPLLS
jgi:hypothetical protein